jgi:hypothetical protein
MADDLLKGIGYFIDPSIKNRFGPVIKGAADLFRTPDPKQSYKRLMTTGANINRTAALGNYLSDLLAFGLDAGGIKGASAISKLSKVGAKGGKYLDDKTSDLVNNFLKKSDKSITGKSTKYFDPINEALEKIGKKNINKLTMRDLFNTLKDNYGLDYISYDTLRKNQNLQKLVKPSGPKDKNKVMMQAFQELGKDKMDKMTGPEISKFLKDNYDLDIQGRSVSTAIKKLYGMKYRLPAKMDRFSPEFITDLKNYVKEYNPTTNEIQEKFPKLREIGKETIREWRRKNKLMKKFQQTKYDKNLLKYSRQYENLDQKSKSVLDNFLEDTGKYLRTGKDARQYEVTKYRIQDKIKEQLGRMIFRGKENGVEINDILKQLEKVNKKQLVETIKKNSILRNRINQADKELGITLDNFNLSHVEDVAKNWKNTLKENNLFFLESDLNQGLQKTLNNKIDSILDNIKKTKTKEQKAVLYDELKNVEKEMIDNNLLSKIQGKFYGDKTITGDSSFNRFMNKYKKTVYEDDPMPTRMNKGGMVGISHLIRPL